MDLAEPPEVHHKEHDASENVFSTIAQGGDSDDSDR